MAFPQRIERARPVHADPDTRAAVARIRAWGEARDWSGYDPYDALNSPLAPFLSLGTPLGRRLLTQSVKLAPVNLRPLLLIEPDRNAKAIGLVASAYAQLWALDRDESARAEAERWLAWLVANRTGEDQVAWGYHFDVQTRFFFYPRGMPNTIATAFATHALLDGCELFGDERWKEPVRHAVTFLQDRMVVDADRRQYFCYIPGDTTLIHNANLLACAVLARARRVAGIAVDTDLLVRSVATSLAGQRLDGSWPYAEGPGRDWADNFHTGYVLEALASCVDLVPDATPQLEDGIRYWHEQLFDSDGRPRNTQDRARPLDGHCYATAIDTWVALRPWRPDALLRARHLAGLLVSDLLTGAGFVRFRGGRRRRDGVPFVRWTTAPSFRALARLLEASG